MIPQDECGSDTLRSRNCSSYVNQPFQDLSAAILTSLIYLKNSWALDLYFSNIILVKIMKAEVHLSIDKKVRGLLFTRHIVPLRICIWPCVSK